MIAGIGLDSVEVKRFESWHTYNKKQLLKVFSEQEITYCLSNTKKSAERFAVRFAAREAFYKAYCSAYPDKQLSFLAMCKQCTITKNNNGSIQLIVNTAFTTHLSVTHTHTTATAFVILTP